MLVVSTPDSHRIIRASGAYSYRADPLAEDPNQIGTRAGPRLSAGRNCRQCALRNTRVSSVDAAVPRLPCACSSEAALSCRRRTLESVRSGDLVHVQWTE